MNNQSLDIENADEVVVVAELSEADAEKLQEAMERLKELQQQQLEQFSTTIAGYREEAIQGRQMSGIEEIWDQDEDAYAGVDDANREEEIGTKRKDKVTLENAFNARHQQKRIKSNAFLNITRPYVDAASARVGDMLLPSDDKNWAIKSTPIPEEVEKAVEGKLGPEIKQMVDEVKGQLDSKLKNVETQIEDWLIETNYSTEVRKAVEDCSRIGTGIIKGPFPKRRKNRNSSEIKPNTKYVDYRNLYPDPACGENIQNGKYLFEKDNLTAKRVKELKGMPGYLSDQIDKVLKEGPGKRLVEDTEIPLQDSEVFEVWHFHGLISKDDMQVCECEPDGEGEKFSAVVTLINDHVVHVNQYHLDNDDFPYDVMCWQKRKDSWAGIGIARQMRTPQRMLNAAIRAMLDNAGISAGPQIIYRRDIIKPEDGSYDLTPNKRWIAEEDADIQSIANAFIAINIPSMQGPLQEIVQFALKTAEDVTGLPMLMQGSQGEAPDTVGGMTILNNNANTVLRRIARSFDSNITIPHIKRYYEWLKMYQNIDTDYTIEARGSSTLVERDIQNQAILQMGQMVLNPAFGVDPALWMQEYLRSLKFDPKRFQQQDEEQDVEKMQMAQQMQAMQQELETRQQEKEMELEYKYTQLKTEHEIAMMRLAAEKNMKVEELQAKLGIERLKLQKGDIDAQQDTQLRAIEGKIKAFEAETKRLSEQTKVNELNYKAATGNQGI